ncbi:4-(cytidine 5'-diphospho)-2-C-methyl-D-erythritol kinase [Paucilactobacillus nenjiangensis]|uniref:4-(cytidine 5'-diphospho)-2-C-methyl-D-erythritol kinase n=1 Tax=Paucilactobacillus nenjiangensis TaxID=1296540 RepID=UPI0028D83849|nr:4-(cytidine 5'-diphospho)-2-C-methyl-D-erythritol kinase [Paucilactobacillus nenjiangensis]
MKIIEKAPAKINLGLDTPRRYADKSPEWDMVMTSIDLADYVSVETTQETHKIKVYTNSGFLPNDQRNLAYQAVHILRTRFHQTDGVIVQITKQIPVAAGLGGGSSDAAAVLRALNKIWNLGLTYKELAKLALTIDSDVPYCIYSQTAHVTGHGEIVTPIERFPHYPIVVAKPKISVSTPTILKQINYESVQHIQIDQLVTAINSGDAENIFASMGNVLEPITAAKYPEIDHLKGKMMKIGSDAAQMSGTGPTMFAVCEKLSRAKRLTNSLKGFCSEVYLVRSL